MTQKKKRKACSVRDEQSKLSRTNNLGKTRLVSNDSVLPKTCLAQLGPLTNLQIEY